MELFQVLVVSLKVPLNMIMHQIQKRFAVLVCDIQSIQLLLLGVNHIRAHYKKTTNWRGEWLSP